MCTKVGSKLSLMILNLEAKPVSFSRVLITNKLLFIKPDEGDLTQSKIQATTKMIRWKIIPTLISNRKER